jgi:hypothetical protein
MESWFYDNRVRECGLIEALSMVRFVKPFWIFFVCWFLFLCLGGIPGCGYHSKPSGDLSSVPYQSLAIPLMKSSSSSLGFEGEFTRAIREEMAGHTKVPLVGKDEAETVLTGRVYEIVSDPLSYDIMQSNVQGKIVTYEVTSSRRIKIKLDASLVERKSGKVLWVDRAMEEKATYEVSADPMSTRYNQRKAIREMARRLAKRIYMKTFERF